MTRLFRENEQPDIKFIMFEKDTFIQIPDEEREQTCPELLKDYGTWASYYRNTADYDDYLVIAQTHDRMAILRCRESVAKSISVATADIAI